jgi:hypothetical protein
VNDLAGRVPKNHHDLLVETITKNHHRGSGVSAYHMPTSTLFSSTDRTMDVQKLWVFFHEEVNDILRDGFFKPRPEAEWSSEDITHVASYR